MPVPVFLFVLWAVWPLAAWPGGKLFAPLVFLIGLFAIRSVDFSKLGAETVALGLLLAWICLTSLWSPADEALFSGSLMQGNFALEAAYLRFAGTFIGCLLFLLLVRRAETETLKPVMIWMSLGVLVHFVAVGIMGYQRDTFLLNPDGFLVPSAQNMGRNANLLIMGLPLLVGCIVTRGTGALAIMASAALVAVAGLLALQLDSLAAVLAIIVGGAGILVLSFVRVNGFRVLMNVAAFGLLAAPGLAWLIVRLAPGNLVHLPLSTEQRLLIWQATVEKIVEKPITGHGINATSVWTDTLTTRPDLLAQLTPQFADNRIIPTHPHNMPLHIWAETGLIGAGLGAIALVLIGRALPAPSSLSPGVRLAAGGIFGAALTFFAVSYSAWDESFWASIAIVLSGVIVLHRHGHTNGQATA